MPKKPGGTPRKALETFPNPKAGRDYTIRMNMQVFTCLCPKTGQPDFATLTLEYVTDELCVELKSLKLYLWSFRNRGCFHEAVTNEILDHLAAALAPRCASMMSRSSPTCRGVASRAACLAMSHSIASRTKRAFASWATEIFIT